MRPSRPSLVLLGSLLSACGGGEDGGGGTPALSRFVDVTNANIPAAAISRACMDVVAHDFDADGDLDLVLAIEFGRNLYLRNDGSGRFTDHSDAGGMLAINADHEDMAVADLDGDGDLDLVFAAEDTNVHELYLNTGGVFVGQQLGPISLANAVAAFDADHDGDQDLLFGGNPRLLLLNDGAANFTTDGLGRVPEPGAIAQDIAIGDVDRDGDADLVWGLEAPNRLALDDGAGFFTDATAGRLPDVVDESRVVLLEDVDRDSDLDLFVGNVSQVLGGGAGTNFLYLNDGTGVFTAAPAGSLPTGSFGTYGARFVDLDADGDRDLVLANADLPSPDNMKGFQVLLNDGSGRFTDGTSAAFGTQDVREHGFGVASGDFNGDGKVDLYLCSRGVFTGGQRVGQNDHLMLAR